MSLQLTSADRQGGIPESYRSEAWLIVALLFLFMVINFADKAVIGIATVPEHGAN